MSLAIVTHEQYETEKAICDKAQAFWNANATFSKGGWSSMSKELSEHPDYAACTNDLRGRVEQYELNRDKPEKFAAYVSRDGQACNVWTSLIIGRLVRAKATKRRRDWQGTVYSYVFESLWGKTYRGFGACGCVINLKQVKS